MNPEEQKSEEESQPAQLWQHYIEDLCYLHGYEPEAVPYDDEF